MSVLCPFTLGMETPQIAMASARCAKIVSVSGLFYALR